MKILLVVDQFDDDNNGTTMTARRLYQGLLRHGNEVRIVSPGREEDNKYRIEEYWLPPLINHIVKGQGMTFGKPDELILREAVGWSDVVHFYMPFPLSRRGLKIAEELKVPHTAAFHVQPENITYTLKLGRVGSVNRLIYRYFRKYFYASFTHIHCPSEFIAEQLRTNGYRSNLHVISNGVQEDFIFHKLPKTKRLAGKFVILMIGRLSDEKRQDVLIEGILKSSYRDQIQLILAGQGLKKKAYERQGSRLTNPPIIKFYSHEELLDVIAMSDLYVHAADAEIEAIACIEAFSSGLVPLISNSQKSATPQFALDQRSLFEAGSSSDLALKIDYWIEHAEERKKAEKLYSEYGKRYSLDHCVVQMEEMFQEVIDESIIDMAYMEQERYD